MHQVRDLSASVSVPVLSTEDRTTLPSIEDISRPSSTSTQSSVVVQSQSTAYPSLPALSTLASVASASSLHLRAFNVGPTMAYATSSPAASVPGQGNAPPVCQNCTTSTTPLWRRDELGSVLCNACGLFLKLHGRPRPISLKTDVIKSRNRVKSGQGSKRKNMFDANGHPITRAETGTPPPGSIGYRRTSGKTSSGASNGSNSPISRTVTPNIPLSSYASPRAMPDGVILPDPSTLPGLHMNRPSPGPTLSINDRHLEPPQSYEAILAANTALRTRVSELEVINDLFRERVAQLESQVNARKNGSRQGSEDRSRSAPDHARPREQDAKRRISDSDQETLDTNGSGPRAKKMRVSDIVDDETPLTPQSATS